ncbi:MAG: hypothetical protein ACR2NR_01625 [Solirubrobacteraceae bacterium]
MSTVTRRAAGLLSLLLCSALLLPTLAGADGDPASDVLLGENVFYPYTPTVANPVQARLNAETNAATRAGFPIKVALIASPPDLGVLPSLFGKPQSYADFLDKEISFRGAQPLLVVMAAGYGIAGVRAPGSLALEAVPKPAGKTSTDLAQAAVTAVSKLASASGHPLTAGSGQRSPSGGSGGNVLLLIVLVLAAVLVATALLVLRARQSSTR